MPNKRSARRRRNRNKKKKCFLKSLCENKTPERIDKLIADCNKYCISKEFKKLLVYLWEQVVYDLCDFILDKEQEHIDFSLSSYFILKHHYEHFSKGYEVLLIGVLEIEAMRDLEFVPGIHHEMIRITEIKIEHFEPQLKIIALIIDENVLQPQAFYAEDYDCTLGFADNGKEKSTNLAKFVTNIWIQCVGGQWMQPFAFILTENPASAAQIREFLFESIEKLTGIGLHVVGVVTKMKANFYELSQELNVSPINSTFKVGTNEVALIFDVPQLMNITRNILMKYCLKFDNLQTSWTDLKQLFLLKQGESKNKLSSQHVKPDINIRTIPKYAIELLSNTVANDIKSLVSLGKLPQSSIGTAEFIDLIDKLFDMLNSQYETSLNEFNSSFKGTKHQNRFFEKVIKFFENLKVFNKGEECTDEVKFINGWLITIKNIQKIWEVMKAGGHPYLLTRNLSCESLDTCMWLTKLPLFSSSSSLTISKFISSLEDIFGTSFFSLDGFSDDEHISMEEYAQIVYNRIPSTKHDLKDDNNLKSANNCSAEDFVKEEFIQEMCKILVEIKYSVLLTA